MSLGDLPVVACKDPVRNVIRVMKHPAYQSHHANATTTQKPSNHSQTQPCLTGAETGRPHILRAFGKKAKVPRPPNAFILYRQHWHPHYKQYNKTMHNNDISKELGRRWKTEPDHVKQKYKTLAEELKAKHAAQYPDYQYAPRKPGEKKRRMTARKLEKLRQARNVQEASDFPSSESSSISGVDSPGHFTLTSNTAETSDFQHFPPNGFDNIDASASSPQPIQYQENDIFTSCLPSTYDDIQAEIQKECGSYNQDYVDVVQDVATDEVAEQHLLQAVPATTFIDNQNEWESLIDWQALNNSIEGAAQMAVDLEDLAAEQALGPDNSHKSYSESDAAWPRNAWG